MLSFLQPIKTIHQNVPQRFQVVSKIASRTAAKTAVAGLALSLSLLGIAKPGAAATTLSFNSAPTLVSGTALSQGAVYRFPNVVAGVDAMVQITTVQNAQLKLLDDNASFPARFQPTIAPSAASLTNSQSYVRFNFKLTPSSTPAGTSFAAAPTATATNVYFSAQDVDGNGAVNTIREFVESIGAVTSYVANPTLLQPMVTLPVAGGIGYEQISSSNVQAGIGTDDRYEFYSFLGTSVNTFSIVGGNITGATGCVLNNTGCDRQNSWTFDVADVQKLDFGDAPIGYGDSYHPVPPIPTVYLGTSVDGDDAPSHTVNADGDDTTGTDDETGVTSFPALTTASTSYSLNVACAGGGTVAGWIDFNRNSVFDASERASGTCSGTSVTLNWTGLSGLSAGATYARFRTASIAAEVTNPTGQASNGEVEDYPVAIAPPPPITITGTVFSDADGSITINGSDAGTNAGSANLTMYAIDTTGKVVDKATVAANGTYNLPNVPRNSSITLRLANDSTVAVGATAPATPSLPSNWVNTGENKNGTTEITTLGDIAVTTTTTNITNQNFGIEQLPNTTDLNPSAQTNPGGTTTVQVPTLAGTDPEDGVLGSGKTFKILTLPTNGTLTYNNAAVTAGQVITNYDPTLLKVDPNDGAITVSFTYTAIDAAGKGDPTPATVTMPFTTPTVDLSVTKTDGQVSTTAGSPISYTITVTNNGSSTVNSVTLTDTLPAAIQSPVFTPSTGSYNSSTGAWTGLNLASGQSITLTVNGTVSASATGTLTNTATVAPPSGVTDPTPGNNTATDTTAVYAIAPTAGQIVINEVLYAQTDSGSAGNDEFIELYNASSSPVDLSNWRLTDGNLIENNTDGIGSITGSSSNPAYIFPNGTTLAPGQYAVIWIGENTANNQATGAAFQTWLGQTAKLNNTGDDVWLYDNQLRIVDYIAYGANNGINTPPPTSLNLWNAAYQTALAGATAGQSISLTPNGVDGNTSACWEPATSGQASTRCTGYLPTTDTDTVGSRLTTVGQNNNGAVATPPNLVLVKRITAINGVDRTGFVDDPGSTDDNTSTFPTPTSTYLRGAIDGGLVRPGDVLEYTIYFLSNGGAPATNVNICDFVPTNGTFVSDAFNSMTPEDAGGLPGVDRGIALGLSSTGFPTVPTAYLSNVEDGDRGRFFPPGTTPPASCLGSNSNGAVIINVVTSPSSLPPATPVSTPTNSYGFIRFRARVN